MAANAGFFVDRSPQIAAAGGRRPVSATIGAADCLSSLEEPETPDVVKRYRQISSPGVGSRTAYFNNVPVNPDTTFGVRSAKDESSTALINPPKPSAFEEKVLASQVRVTAAQKKQQLHRMQLLNSGTSFGKVEESTGTATECLQPERDSNVSEEDDILFKTRYKKSHGSYEAGEQVSRGYGRGFDHQRRFGESTPADVTGSGAKKSLQWTSPAQSAKIVSSRQQQRANADAKINPNAVFGISTKPSEADDTVHDLLSSGNHAESVELLGNTMRAQLRVSEPDTFLKLEQEFLDRDVDGTGVVTTAALHEVCSTMNLHLGARTLREAADVLAKNDTIDYMEFVNLLRPPSTVTDDASSPVFGMKTIRTDLAPPSRVSVSDMNNYGDQGTAGTVLAPDKFTSRGISDADLRKMKTKEQIEAIFLAADLNQTHDFEAVWTKAQELDGTTNTPHGATIRSFKAALDSI
eukprot:m.296385 g.296385  ORF g.296385 m.296385 type:complete len:465 (-) comp20059_c0_seq1:87-1481(-)